MKLRHNSPRGERWLGGFGFFPRPSAPLVQIRVEFAPQRMAASTFGCPIGAPIVGKVVADRAGVNRASSLESSGRRFRASAVSSEKQPPSGWFWAARTRDKKIAGTTSWEYASGGSCGEGFRDVFAGWFFRMMSSARGHDLIDHHCSVSHALPKCIQAQRSLCVALPEEKGRSRTTEALKGLRSVVYGAVFRGCSESNCPDGERQPARRAHSFVDNFGSSVRLEGTLADTGISSD